MNRKPFSIANTTVNPGEFKSIELQSTSLYTQTPINVPIHVIHGKKNGPRLFVISAIHGDEINGVEIIRRLMSFQGLKKLCGTLIAVPVANVHGFISLSRYLPDRRDLNRSFPGSSSGSLAARLAHLFIEEIICKCTHGIDLHTGNLHSENLPHVRGNLDAPGVLKMARAFNVPLILDAKLRDGSLRQAATELNIPMVLYEGGEGLRFNELAIRIGLRGVLRVMRALGMLPALRVSKRIRPRIATQSNWVRSIKSGILHQTRELGSDVEKGEKLGFIADPFTLKETEIISNFNGIIIGRNTLPLINEGDALFHIARLKGSEEVSEQINELQHYYADVPVELE